MASSLGPEPVHHERSKSRMARSRSVSSMGALCCTGPPIARTLGPVEHRWDSRRATAARLGHTGVMLDVGDAPAIAPVAPSQLQAHGVSRRFGSTLVLDDVDLVLN